MAFDPAKVKVSATFKHPGSLESLCQEADTGRLLAGADDFGIHVYDPASKKTEAVATWTKHSSYVSALVALKQGGKSIVVSGSYDRQLIWWDAATGQVIRTVEGHEGWIRHVVPTPDATRLVSVGDDMLVKVWDAATGKLIRFMEGHAKLTPQGHVTALYSVAVSPDGKHVVSGDRHGEARVWELETGKLLSTFQVPTLYTFDPRQRKRSMGGIRSLAFSNDGNTVAAGGIGQIGNVDGLGGPIHLELWDWRKPQLRITSGAKGQKGMINALLFLPDNEWLLGAGGGGSGFLAFWKINVIPEGGKTAIPDAYTKFDGHAHRLNFNAGKGELYVAGYRKLEIWKLNE